MRRAWIVTISSAGAYTGIPFCPLGGPLPSTTSLFSMCSCLWNNSEWHQDLVLLFEFFFLVKADFRVFCKNFFGGTAQIIIKQVSPTLIRILFYYSAHFLNLTLIECILYFIITNKQLAVLKMYGCALWWLMTVSAFQFQMRFRGLELIWKINCSWKPGTGCSCTDQPGAPLQLPTPFSGLDARAVEWGAEEGEVKGGWMGEREMPSLSQSFPTNPWNLSGGETNILFCLMNTVSGRSPEFPSLH